MTSESVLREAIQRLLDDYRTEGCSEPDCSVCQASKDAVKFAQDALKGVNLIEQYVKIYGEKRRDEIASTVGLVVSREFWQQKKWNWDTYFEDLFR